LGWFVLCREEKKEEENHSQEGGEKKGRGKKKRGQRAGRPLYLQTLMNAKIKPKRRKGKPKKEGGEKKSNPLNHHFFSAGRHGRKEEGGRKGLGGEGEEEKGHRQ